MPVKCPPHRQDVSIFSDGCNLQNLFRPREQLAGPTKSIHRSNKNVPFLPPLLSIFDFDACYEGSTGGQIGVEFNQKSTGDVGFFPALSLADQSEAENANFLVI